MSLPFIEHGIFEIYLLYLKKKTYLINLEITQTAKWAQRTIFPPNPFMVRVTHLTPKVMFVAPLISLGLFNIGL